MKSSEFITELRKKKVIEPDIPYDPGWERLSYLKEEAARKGEQMAGSLQLFMPRAYIGKQTVRDRRMSNLSNRYAHDEEGNLKPSYEKWEQGRKDLSGIGASDPLDSPIEEAAPILKPGKASSPPGSNKPTADLWTSTARKFDNNTYTSDWVRYAATNNPTFMAPTGYLYRVKPGALILEIDDHSAEDIMSAFQNLGSAPEFNDDDRRFRKVAALRSKFPWDQIVKHFDGVWNNGHMYGSDGFTYGWDCESTAWLDTSFLQLLGEVSINQNGLSADNGVTWG